MFGMDQERTPCPLCGTLCSSSKRLAHMKHCSQRLQLKPEQLIAAAQLQVKHEEERKALGLPPVKVPPPSRRDGNTRNQNLKRLKEPKNKTEADIQMALAMSASLQPAQEGEMERVAILEAFRRGGRKTKGNAPTTTPDLILVSDEQRQQKLAEKVARLLADPAPQCKEVGSSSKQSSRSSRLWSISSQSEEEAPDACFYVSGLVELQEGQKLGSKLWNLSQVAGRKTNGDSTLHDLCYSLEARVDWEMHNSKQDLEVVEEEPEANLDFSTQGGFCSKAGLPGNKLSSQHPSTKTATPADLKGIASPSYDTHATDLKQLIGSPLFSDAAILSVDKEIPVHKAIIYARCPAFLEGKLDTEFFDLSSFSSTCVRTFLHYIYSGTVDKFEDSGELLQLAQRYKLPHLEELINISLQDSAVDTSTRTHRDVHASGISVPKRKSSLDGLPSISAQKHPSTLDSTVSPSTSRSRTNICVSDVNSPSKSLTRQVQDLGIGSSLPSTEKTLVVGAQYLRNEHITSHSESDATSSCNNDMFSSLSSPVKGIVYNGIKPTKSRTNLKSDLGEKFGNTSHNLDSSSSHHIKQNVYEEEEQENAREAIVNDDFNISYQFEDSFNQLGSQFTTPAKHLEKELSPSPGGCNSLKDRATMSNTCQIPVVIDIASDSEEKKYDDELDFSMKKERSSLNLQSSPELFGEDSEDDVSHIPDGRLSISSKTNDFTVLKEKGTVSSPDCQNPTILKPNEVNCRSPSSSITQDSFFRRKRLERDLSISPEHARHSSRYETSLKSLGISVINNNSSKYIESDHISIPSHSPFSSPNIEMSTEKSFPGIQSSSLLECAESKLDAKELSLDHINDVLSSPKSDVSDGDNLSFRTSARKLSFSGDEKMEVEAKCVEEDSLFLSSSSSSEPSSPCFKSLSERLAVKHGLSSSPCNVKVKKKRLKTGNTNSDQNVEVQDPNKSLNLPVWDDFEHFDDQDPASRTEKHDQTASQNHLQDFYVRRPIAKSKSKQSTDKQSSEPGKVHEATKSLSNSQASTCLSQPPSSQQQQQVAKKKVVKKGPANQNLNVTPLPDYQVMITPELKEALTKFGVKKMPRKKAVNLLNHIYYQTHPDVERQTLTQESSSKMQDIPEPKARSLSQGAKSATIRSKPKKKKKASLDNDSSLSSAHSTPSKSSSMGSELEDFAPNQPVAADFKEAVKKFILSNEDIHEKVLFFEPICVPDFMEKLQKIGLKTTIPTLYAFFDEQGITYSNPDDNKRRRTKRSDKTTKKKKSPKKQSPSKKKS